MMCMQHHKKEESEGCENVPAMGWLRSDERAVSVVLSIPIYECLGCARRQLANALEQNDEQTAVVLHVNAVLRDVHPAALAAFTARVQSVHGERLAVNPERVTVYWQGPTILRAHVVNFKHATRAFPAFTHFSMIAADMLFVRPGYAAYIRSYDGLASSCAEATMFARRASEDPELRRALGGVAAGERQLCPGVPAVPAGVPGAGRGAGRTLRIAVELRRARSAPCGPRHSSLDGSRAPPALSAQALGTRWLRACPLALPTRASLRAQCWWA